MLFRFKSGSRHIATGNIQQNINPSPFGYDFFGYFFQARDVKDIADDTDYIVTILFEFSYTVVQLLLTNVNSYYFCSLLYKVLGNISTQYTTCSGNNSDFTGNTK